MNHKLPSETAISAPIGEDEEREACLGVDPPGFHLRGPPPPHELRDFITHDDKLFQTIHMGPAVVDKNKWRLVVTGMVKHPFSISFNQLLRFEKRSVTSFHECYGSPIKPPVQNLWRVGNVTWTGVRLRDLLALAEPDPEAKYIWSEGLDHGSFAGSEAIDRYQKDLPISKAMMPEVLVAWEMNGEKLSKKRGGPVRLIVPGWFGTNSSRWLCKLSLQKGRASSLFTTKWYIEIDPRHSDGRMRPVWEIEVNSLITQPAPDEVVEVGDMAVQGWAWSCDGVEKVEISIDGGKTWKPTEVARRKEFEWQRWKTIVQLDEGPHSIVARATSQDGIQQPLSGRRNHVHTMKILVHQRDSDTISTP